MYSNGLYIQLLMAEVTYVDSWPMIPPSAFLYFPAGDEVRIGQDDKQWRKIFESGEPYEEFEVRQMARLEDRLASEKVDIDPWFTQPNKLRYLQANKFKVAKTIESMAEYSSWRIQAFPLVITQQIERILNQGGLYFSGRDLLYRPIIVVDISKFKEDDEDLIPSALVLLMEFMIKCLLVEGQVENYVLIMNLDGFSWGLRNVVMRIISFTSNSYRGRLFVSYLLSMPTLLKFGWNSIVSNFVSQNTLKKLKISGDPTNEDMWTHISKHTVEQLYGGTMPSLRSPYWPPTPHIMLLEHPHSTHHKLVTQEHYRHLYQTGRLNNRKVKKEFVEVQPKQLHIPSVVEPENQEHLHSSRKLAVMIRGETSFIKDVRSIKTFFEGDAFRKISVELMKQERVGLF